MRRRIERTDIENADGKEFHCGQLRVAHSSQTLAVQEKSSHRHHAARGTASKAARARFCRPSRWWKNGSSSGVTLVRMPADDHDRAVAFTCNICGACNVVEHFATEPASCGCGSNV